jgi:type I site-specific restriction endonuclease
MTEAGSRVIIDKLLSEVGWILIESDRNRNVDFEVTNEAGRLDYLLRDSNGFPLCILEAKSELKDPLDGKEQARNYKIQNTLLFHIFNRIYVVLVFIGLILKRNMSMKNV